MLLGLVVRAFGGQVWLVQGAVEFSGGLTGALLRDAVRFNAITFGHVILGVSRNELDAARRHEHVHVRQYEAWGPFFLFAYAASSLWQLLRGRRVYRDNFFEQQAFAAEDRLRAS